MVIHHTYACIRDKKIQQLICVDTGDNYIAQQLCRASWGENSIAIEVSQYDVTEGDFYVDGVFYKADKDDPTKAGKVVTRTNTPDEDAYEANVKATAAQLAAADNSVNIEYLMACVESTDDLEDTTEDTGDESESTSTSESASEASDATSETAE